MFRSSLLNRIPQYNFGHPALSKKFGTSTVASYSPGAAPAAQTTALPNGVTITSRDLGGATACFGFYVDAGAKYDPVSAPGLSYVMRFAIPTSNMDSSLFQLDRTMRAHGVAYGHGEIRKRFLLWKGEGLRDSIAKPFEAVGSCVAAPRFHEADVERFRDTMDNLLEEQRWQQPRTYCIDQLEALAFYKEPLGSPRHVWSSSNDNANHTALLDHWASHFTPSRITVAAVNIPHEELVAMYTGLPFPHSAEAPHHARAPKPTVTSTAEGAQFYAGKQLIEVEDRAKAMCTKPDMDPEVIAALGWQTAGRGEGVAKYAAAVVAHELLNVVIRDGINYDRADTTKGTRGFYRPYETCGLLGFTVRGTEGSAKSQIANVVDTLAEIKPSAAQRDAARGRAAVALFSNELERPADYTDFLATAGASEAELEAAIRATPDASIDAIIKSLTAVTPSMFVTGNATAFPSLKQLGMIRK